MTPSEREIRDELRASIFKGNRLMFAVTLALRLAYAVGDLVFAYLLKVVVDAAATSSLESLAKAALGTAALVLVQEGVIMNAMRFTYARFLARAVHQYRQTAFSRLLEKGTSAYWSEDTRQYLSSLTNDVTTIETTYLEKVFLLVEQVFTFFVALGMLVAESPLLALAAVVLCAVPLAVSVLSGRRMAAHQRSVSDQNASFLALTQDYISGFPVIKGFKAEREAREQFGRASRRVEEAKYARRVTERTVDLFGNVANAVSQFGVLLVGALLCIAGTGLTVGGATMALQLMNSIAGPISTVPSLLAARRASLGLIDKLAEALEGETDREGTAQLPARLERGIGFRGVSFAYDPARPVLSGLDAEFPAGGCYALVGASGSGKSTMLGLLAGRYTGYAGSVALDGVEVRDAQADSLFDLVSLVQQDAFLFDASLRDNITMFKDVDPARLASAVSAAGLDDFVAENGLDYACGERGMNLSGGERQRVAVARSLLLGSSVLLLDEATSALDQVTEEGVMGSILGLGDVTRIVVLHSLSESVLRRFDAIYVLRDGRICEQGGFDELLARRGYFHALFTVGQ